MVPQWKCLFQIHILSLKTGFWFFCLFCFMFITAHMWVKKYSQWLYCFIAYSINFIFPIMGKISMHTVCNSTELHMCWTPGAINLLSSRKASKILRRFFFFFGLVEILHVHSVILHTKAQRHSVWQKTGAGTPAVNCLCYQPDFPLLHPEWQYSL